MGTCNRGMLVSPGKKLNHNITHKPSTSEKIVALHTLKSCETFVARNKGLCRGRTVTRYSQPSFILVSSGKAWRRLRA